MTPLIIGKIFTTLKNSLVAKIVVIILVVLILIVLLKKKAKAVIQSFKDDKFDTKVTEDPQKVALAFRAASNPTGNGWMIDWDGTDEEAFDTLARKIKELKSKCRMLIS